MVKEKIELLLRKIYPDRDNFSDAEVQLAMDVYAALKYTDGRTAELPTRFVPMGGIIRVKGRHYKCVRRPNLAIACEACSGCAFSGGTCPEFLQCSSFDRMDKKNVWFEEVI